MAKWGRWAAAGGALVAAGAAYALFVRREKMSEQPIYRVVERDGAIELRDYPELLVAETVAAGPRRVALDRGFARLADYIFAKRRSGERIAMTAPVLSAPAAEAGWRTRFVMPGSYQEATLPAPQAGVAIARVPARRVAALRFNGTPDDAVLGRREADLRAWLAARGLPNDGQVEHAFYNSPFVPGALRRNEVLIALS